MGGSSGSQGARPVSARWSRRGVTILVAVFLVVIAAIVGVAAVGLEVLTSVRAYVGGEGLWSKAEKDAASALSRYIEEGDEAYYREFLKQLAVPLGDRRAREELERPRPDFAIARAGFLQGRNHPADVDGMSRLFVRFRRFEHLDRAIAIWQRGDGLIAQLAKVGEDVHSRASAGRLTEEERRSFLREVERHRRAGHDPRGRVLGHARRSRAVGAGCPPESDAGDDDSPRGRGARGLDPHREVPAHPGGLAQGLRKPVPPGLRGKSGGHVPYDPRRTDPRMQRGVRPHPGPCDAGRPQGARLSPTSVSTRPRTPP